ncbi:MAG TPA: DUF1501 domain-containing protein [Planctomycetaceae bacterium]|nr:DUF1501 domain-containing protein [Planctomycetaceae bacterium]
MLAIGSRTPQGADGVSRRDFLRFGGLGVLGLSAAEQRARAEANGTGSRRCIFLLLNGGASQFETFDPKPTARVDIRGPHRAIATATPGVQLSETLPLLAQRSGKFALLRSLCHDAAPLHETGLQLVQTGRLVRGDLVPPSTGSIIARLLGPRNDWPAYVVLPRPLGECGSAIWQGQWAGSLGEAFDPWFAETEPATIPIGSRGLDLANGGDEVTAQYAAKQSLVCDWLRAPDAERRSYGDSDLARSCLAARRLIEQGVRFVTINMFDTLAERITWDCHANGAWAPATLGDYRNVLCPDLDRALSALLDDLEQRGLLDETLVVVTGEFGRTPRISEGGGRDHSMGVWSALIAGGGVCGGQAVGASDARGALPAERPISPAELTATILERLGVDLSTRLALPDGGELALADAEPIHELLA